MHGNVAKSHVEYIFRLPTPSRELAALRSRSLVLTGTNVEALKGICSRSMWRPSSG